MGVEIYATLVFYCTFKKRHTEEEVIEIIENNDKLHVRGFEVRYGKSPEELAGLETESKDGYVEESESENEVDGELDDRPRKKQKTERTYHFLIGLKKLCSDFDGPETFSLPQEAFAFLAQITGDSTIMTHVSLEEE